MAGERDVLAEALHNLSFGGAPVFPVYGHTSGEAADAILATLAARGYTLSRSEAEPEYTPGGLRYPTLDELHGGTSDLPMLRPATPPEPAREALDVGERDVLLLAALIRRVDGNHDLGASALAEAILERGYTLSRSEPLRTVTDDEPLLSINEARRAVAFAATPPEPAREALDVARLMDAEPQKPDPQSFVPGYRIRYVELETVCAFLVDNGWAGGIGFDEAVKAGWATEGSARDGG